MDQRARGSGLDIGAEVIVLGDLNDGPGLDVYEELFARSSVEIIMGQSQGPKSNCLIPMRCNDRKDGLTRRAGSA